MRRQLVSMLGSGAVAGIFGVEMILSRVPLGDFAGAGDFDPFG